MIEDGTGIRHHAKVFGDVGTVIPPIILYRKANFNEQDVNFTLVN